MKEYDLDRIKDYVSMEDICDLLGIEKRRIGGLTSVLCPFHDDENFGNAFIKNNKITCFACGKTGDIFDVYMHQTGMSLMEAAAEISSRFGLSDVMSQKQSSLTIPFSKQELAAIGLLREERNTEKYPVSILESPEKMPGFTVQKETTYGYSMRTRKMVAVVDDYVVSKKGQSMYKHLVDLFESDKKSFFGIVRSKCREYYTKYNTAIMTINAIQDELSQYGVHDSFLDYQKKIASEMLALVNSAYDKAVWKVYKKPGRKIA